MSAFKVKPINQLGLEFQKQGLNYFPLHSPNLNIILIYVKGLLSHIKYNN